MSTNFEILDSITESMGIINKSGEIIFTNKAWRSFSDDNMGDDSCTGLNSNYFVICDAVEGEESNLAQQATFGINQVINGERGFFELEYPCHSPTENRWFILRASKVKSNPELTLLAHINITNRKITELEVEKNYIHSLTINERLNTTLYKIIHDIQHPLSNIKSLIDISKSQNENKTINKYLERIEQGSNNLSLFVKETLKQITSSDEIQSVEVEQMVKNYLDTIEHLLQSNSIEVKLKIKQPDKFSTNAVEFRSIMSNLIGNSIKYCDNLKLQKHITVSFNCDSKSARLTVEDNGLGIKKQDIPKITQRNYQVNNKISDGAGLGLFMVEKSVNKLGGSLKIKSKFGEGSKFIVDIPNQAIHLSISKTA